MSTNVNLQRVDEWSKFRGFANLFRKENGAWWGTRRWWINALLWPGMLGGLVSVMLFMLPAMTAVQNPDEVAAAGGPIEYATQLGIAVFFRMGSMALALGAIVLSQDLFLDEKQSGVTEWLLAKPVARRSYVLAKVAASILAILVLLVALPAVVMYLLLYVRLGAPYDLVLFLKGTGILAVHTFFYLTLTMMLGTFFSSRIPILGVALGIAMGGSVIGGIIKPLLSITPWILGNTTELVVMGKATTSEMVIFPLIATILWCFIFIFVAVFRFEKTQF